MSKQRKQQDGSSTSRRPPRSSRRRRSNAGLWWLGGGVLLLLLGIALIASQNRSPAGAAQDIPYPEVPRIALAEANARHQAGDAIFVDVRSQTEYDAAHITDALHIPLTEMGTGSGDLPQDAEIITYCT